MIIIPIKWLSLGVYIIFRQTHLHLKLPVHLASHWAIVRRETKEFLKSPEPILLWEASRYIWRLMKNGYFPDD